MNRLSASQIVVIVLHALAVWALCFAVIGIGMATLPQQTALIVHAIAAPIITAAVSWVYFTRFHYTAPLPTALALVAIVMFLDFILVALVILRSLDMFRSLIGTWVPFGLIFLSTWLTGLALEARARAS